MLGDVRQRIRRYVWLEGLAIALVWLAVTFWIGLALDYLPVRMGASEMPVVARGVLLAIISLMLLFILYRWVLRRTFVQLRDASLAILIERKFPQFQDSLVTIVELDADPQASELQDGMLQSVREKAERCAAEVDVERVFNYWPLRRALWAAGVLLGSIVLFAVLAWPAFGLWVNRLYGLSEATYPRQTELEMVGFEQNQTTVARAPT